jgi:hypothetical protein
MNVGNYAMSQSIDPTAARKAAQLNCPPCPACGRATRLVSVEPQMQGSVEVCAYRCSCGHEIQRAYDRPVASTDQAPIAISSVADR